MTKKWLSREVRELLPDGSIREHGLAIVTASYALHPQLSASRTRLDCGPTVERTSMLRSIAIEPFEAEAEGIEFTDSAILISRAPSLSLTFR